VRHSSADFQPRVGKRVEPHIEKCNTFAWTLSTRDQFCIAGVALTLAAELPKGLLRELCGGEEVLGDLWAESQSAWPAEPLLLGSLLGSGNHWASFAERRLVVTQSVLEPGSITPIVVSNLCLSQ